MAYIKEGTMQDGSKFISLKLNDAADNELNVYDDGSVDTDDFEADLVFDDLLEFVERARKIIKVAQ